ncbi:MAG: GIY-YIG nuclease family protein [Anaerolineae bacterium]|nr:GIY-YIG nuclease family protein [Anaerolineae bacterium]
MRQHREGAPADWLRAALLVAGSGAGGGLLADRSQRRPELTRAAGTYVLLLSLPQTTPLVIGRLGAFDFPAGWYTYVGSAFGPGGLRGRLSHHLAPVTKPHWHIDHLRQAAICREVWFTADEISREHDWATALRTSPGASMPAPRFGASDCACPTHLIHFADKPDLTAILGGEIVGQVV